MDWVSGMKWSGVGKRWAGVAAGLGGCKRVTQNMQNRWHMDV